MDIETKWFDLLQERKIEGVMPEIGLIRSLLEELSGKVTRSTVLNPLGWITAMLLSATLFSFYIKTPVWLSIIFTLFTCVTMILYLFAYMYCFIKDRDALRSETYIIKKLAIEKGYIGDDISGLFTRKNVIKGMIEFGDKGDKEEK